MIKGLVGLLCLGLLPSLAMAAEPCKRLTATGNPEYPPYLWHDSLDPQHLVGANADLVTHLANSLGLEIDVLYVGPWSRAQEEVRTGRIDLMAGYFITDARQQQMDYILPAFLYTPSVIWARQGHDFVYGQWSDLQGLKGGTLVNNSHGEQFDAYARQHLLLEAVPSARQAFEKLMHGRSDYVIYEQYPGMALARTLGIDQQVLILQPPVSSEGLYLALSKASPCNQPALREALGRAMQQLHAQDVPQQLLRLNLERSR